MSELLTHLGSTEVLLAIFLGTFFLFLLCALVRPYRVSNSFLLLICLLALVLTLASLAVEGTKEIVRIGALAIVVALLLAPLLLIWNGIVILKRESGKFANYLPLLLGVVIAAGEIASMLFLVRDSFDVLAGVRRPILFAVGASVFYVAALLLAFVLYMLLLPLLSRKRSFDAVIIHGCALIRGDQVSRILARRLDLALKLYRRSKGKALLIDSGGQGSDETVSEAAAMRDYLLEKGVSAEQILLEDQSHSTKENLSFSARILAERGAGGRVALVTSDYHVFRCLWIAKELAFRCKGFGAPVAAYYWPSAVIREFVAVYSRKRYFIAAFLGYLLLVVLPTAYMLLHGA